MVSRVEALRRLLQKMSTKGSEALDTGLDILDRPGRATRAAIGAAQDDKGFSDIMSAAGAQLKEGAPEAPSGADIAERVGEKYDIQNPLALAALATAADVVDPTIFVPGGQVTKLGKAGKLGKMGMKAGDAKKLGKTILKPEAPEKIGKVILRDDAVPKSSGMLRTVDTAPTKPGQVASQELQDSVQTYIPKQKVDLKNVFSEEEALDVMNQFPQARKAFEEDQIVKKAVLKKMMKGED